MLVPASLKFDLSSELYPDSFPRTLSLDETDALTAFPFKDSFKAAQDAGLPYYSVTVVESGNPGEKKYFQIYDTSFLSTHVFNQGPFCKDPLTGRPIQKVHFFAAECFKFDKQQCYPIDISTGQITLSKFKIENALETKLQTILLDCLNSNIVTDGTPEAKFNVRRMQYIVAAQIQKGQLFSHLLPEERKAEEIRWLWSSAQGSYVALVHLVKESFQLNPCISKECVRDLLCKRLHPLPKKEEMGLKESKAIVEALDLSKKLEKEINAIKTSTSTSTTWTIKPHNNRKFKDYKGNRRYPTIDGQSGIRQIGGQSGIHQKK